MKQRMTNDSIGELLTDAIPELRDSYGFHFENWGDPPPPGGYIVIGVVMYPWLVSRLQEEPPPEQLLNRAFQFLEEMASSNEPEMINLLGLEMTDRLLHEPELLSKAWKHIGPSTKAVMAKAARYLNLEKNLPA